MAAVADYVQSFTGMSDTDWMNAAHSTGVSFCKSACIGYVHDFVFFVDNYYGCRIRWGRRNWS